jgi:hypothetical protein
VTPLTLDRRDIDLLNSALAKAKREGAEGFDLDCISRAEYVAYKEYILKRWPEAKVGGKWRFA